MTYTDFEEVDIQDYLDIVCRLIDDGKRTLEITKDCKIRKKNIKFMRKYKLKEKNIDELMKSLIVKDFCYAVDEENVNFSDERLFVFCPQKELDYFGINESVDIYIKLKKHTMKDDSEIVLYMSFHEREKEITYLFRDKS
jgi:hypothetical protein